MSFNSFSTSKDAAKISPVGKAKTGPDTAPKSDKSDKPDTAKPAPKA